MSGLLVALDATTEVHADDAELDSQNCVAGGVIVCVNHHSVVSAAL